MNAGHPSAPIETVPRGALIAAGILVVMTIVLAATARLTGVGVTRQPEVPLVSSVDVYFGDRPDGTVVVSRAPDGREIGRLAPGTNGFARSTLRGLVRERKRSKIGPDAPFTLSRWADGRLSLSDRATGRNIDLDVFGPTNAAVFAELELAGSR
jgi:putative photosynthetic complex assembly protein